MGVVIESAYFLRLSPACMALAASERPGIAPGFFFFLISAIFNRILIEAW
jgi:hypothetical protein